MGMGDPAGPLGPAFFPPPYRSMFAEGFDGPVLCENAHFVPATAARASSAAWLATVTCESMTLCASAAACWAARNFPSASLAAARARSAAPAAAADAVTAAVTRIRAAVTSSAARAAAIAVGVSAAIFAARAASASALATARGARIGSSGFMGTKSSCGPRKLPAFAPAFLASSARSRAIFASCVFAAAMARSDARFSAALRADVASATSFWACRARASAASASALAATDAASAGSTPEIFSDASSAFFTAAAALASAAFAFLAASLPGSFFCKQSAAAFASSAELRTDSIAVMQPKQLSTAISTMAARAMLISTLFLSWRLRPNIRVLRQPSGPPGCPPGMGGRPSAARSPQVSCSRRHQDSQMGVCGFVTLPDLQGIRLAWATRRVHRSQQASCRRKRRCSQMDHAAALLSPRT